MRAIAVIAVIAYHLGAPWAKGGLLGVGVFFTLSGYLITDLLLADWRREGDLGLGEFWLRRARRLLAALFVMLAVVSVLVAVFDAGQLPTLRGQLLGAAFYFSNWLTIAEHGSYFAHFASPPPLDHLWSLAIEEQFYLIWPWLLLAGIWTLRSSKKLALATLVGAAGSALTMGLLFHPGYDPTRVYEGTDTRAFGLLIGAALAFVWPVRRRAGDQPVWLRSTLDALGLAGLLVILVLLWRMGSFSPFLYPIGFCLLAAATTAVLAAAVVPGSTVARSLAWGPLRWVGVRSYGIYLWHWPVIVLIGLSQGRVGPSRALVAVAVTVLAASLSWRYVEVPVRHGALGRLWRELRTGRRLADRPMLAPAGVTLGVLIAVLGFTGFLPAASPGLADQGRDRVRPVTDTPKAASAPLTPTQTSCRSVVYIGDSTSEGETSSSYLPDPSERLPSQLAKVGVKSTHAEISGARSIVETYEGKPNAASVARDYRARGYRGCFILALGTNEVANVHDGSRVGFAERIERMMSNIGPSPVMWVNVLSLRRGSGDSYAAKAMEGWNSALLGACRRYPTMRVFDWAAHARSPWFIADGIHYTTPGYRERTHLIARALAGAFPAQTRGSGGCVVR